MHDDITFRVIRGQGQGQEMTSVPSGLFFECTGVSDVVKVRRKSVVGAGLE